MWNKKALVIHSGGMDSSICLALAIKEFGNDNILSLSFSYNQRHAPELIQAAKICHEWKVNHKVLDIDCLKKITNNALLDSSLAITQEKGKPPNTLVMGRNGLMARIGAIHAHYLGANCIYMGVIEVEGSHSGYRDCSRHYMDLEQAVLRLDLDNLDFEIRTPLVYLSKCETMHLADSLGVLEYLLEETITCYEGIRHSGCKICPACVLRNRGIEEFHLASQKPIPYRKRT